MHAGLPAHFARAQAERYARSERAAPFCRTVDGLQTLATACIDGPAVPDVVSCLKQLIPGNSPVRQATNRRWIVDGFFRLVVDFVCRKQIEPAAPVRNLPSFDSPRRTRGMGHRARERKMQLDSDMAAQKRQASKLDQHRLGDLTERDRVWYAAGSRCTILSITRRWGSHAATGDLHDSRSRAGFCR